ncbi:MAG: helix-turn-helix transcriptional regulator [Lachnospiraceae bacterium]|nr:helix-turn-helix transcriptional regulator [Lachnospiraceae bacterium]
MKLKELRNKVNMTQAELAEKVYVPVATIRKWEKGTAIPAFSYMQLIADAMKVELQEVISAFAPETTKLDTDTEYENKLAGYLEEMFNASSDIETFFLVTSLFGVGNTKGIVACDDAVFPFTRVICDEPGESYAVMLRDDNFNRVVLTMKNVLKVTPVSARYDVYNFDIIVNCPIFPVDEEYNPETFEQSIRVSFFY